MGEYRANMNALGQRLQTVEELAEKEMNITDRVHSRKSIVNVISIDTSKEDV
jgi:hypothetical protein